MLAPVVVHVCAAHACTYVCIAASHDQTKDNVFVTAVVSVQYQPIKSKVCQRAWNIEWFALFLSPCVQVENLVAAGGDFDPVRSF